MKKIVFLFIFLLIATPALAAPSVQKVTSPSGIKAWLMRDTRLPLLSISFAFKGGVEYDPADKQGLATLTTALLTQGAGDMDSGSFQEALAQNSIQLDFSAARDALYGSLKTTRATKEKAFHLLALALIKPHFAQEDLTRLRQQQKMSVRFQTSDPDWQARAALLKEGFGSHPYAYRSQGTLRTLDNISREDCIHFMKSHMARENLLIAVAGNISPKELAAALDKIFAPLPSKKSFVDLPPAPWKDAPFTLLVPQEGTQTQIFFALPSLHRNNPLWQAASIANYILGGGGFSSRLMKKVRIEKGLTYGISTGLAPMDKAALLLGQMSSNNDKAARAAALTKDVWQDYYEDGPKDEEVKAAKDYLIGAQPLTLTSTNQAADLLLSFQLEHLPIDYLDKREDEIRRVTKEEINAAIKKWFDPAKLSFVFVGKPENLSDVPLRALQNAGE